MEAWESGMGALAGLGGDAEMVALAESGREAAALVVVTESGGSDADKVEESPVASTACILSPIQAAAATAITHARKRRTVEGRMDAPLDVSHLIRHGRRRIAAGAPIR